jgi:Zn-dependent peptidase ImmA (M78 family)
MHVKKVIFSSEIIMFKEDLHKRILEIYNDVQKLNSLLEKLKDSNDPTTRRIFQLSLKEGREYEKMYPRKIIQSAEKMRDSMLSEIRRYKSFSWLLLILVVVSAIMVGIVDVIKDSDYFNGQTNTTSNLTNVLSNLTKLF